jgi:hypothetical protein
MGFLTGGEIVANTGMFPSNMKKSPKDRSKTNGHHHDTIGNKDWSQMSILFCITVFKGGS